MKKIFYNFYYNLVTETLIWQIFWSWLREETLKSSSKLIDENYLIEIFQYFNQVKVVTLVLLKFFSSLKMISWLL